MRLHYKQEHPDIPEYEYPMAFIEMKRIEERKYLESKKAKAAAEEKKDETMTEATEKDEKDKPKGEDKKEEAKAEV